MIGLKEIRRRKFQFALIALIVALISYLVLMISGLGIGLNRQAGSALLILDADGLAFAKDSDLSVIRSELSPELVADIGGLGGVTESAPLGYLGVNTRDEAGEITSAALLGYRPGSIAEPAVSAGDTLSAEDNRGLLADRAFLDRAGLAVGDDVTIPSRLDDYVFSIVGEVDEGYFFFQPVVFVLLDSWQDVKYGSEGAAPEASIVLVKGQGVIGLETDDYEIVSKGTAFSNIEGVQGQQSTVTALQVFGYLIGALVIGIFFYVLTMQKLAQIGLLKALGATTGYVFRQLLIQVLVLILVGIAVSFPVAVTTGAALEQLPQPVPIAFTTATFLMTSLLLLATGLVGTLFSLRQIVSVDPIIALGHQE